MRVAFLPGPTGAAAEAEDPADPEQDRRLAIQAFPGPYTYAAMSGFLTAMADALGWAPSIQQSLQLWMGLCWRCCMQSLSLSLSMIPLPCSIGVGVHGGTTASNRTEMFSWN